MPYRFIISPDGRRGSDADALSGRDAARILRTVYGTAARTALPEGVRAPDWSTGACLRVAIQDYPHALRVPFALSPVYVRAVYTPTP